MPHHQLHTLASAYLQVHGTLLPFHAALFSAARGDLVTLLGVCVCVCVCGGLSRGSPGAVVVAAAGFLVWQEATLTSPAGMLQACRGLCRSAAVHLPRTVREPAA
jgi:hypothetical protein